MIYETDLLRESGRAILTSVKMLEYLGHKPASQAIEKAVRESISNNETTRDLGGNRSTEQVGSAILERLVRLSDKLF
ncbi:MAG: isocitrate/isopropylmalate family dehydrogenase [Pyrinomonadaceae bacterium]